MATVQAKSQLLFGRQDGSLAHIEDSFVTVNHASVDLHDFIVNARFLNPYSMTTGSCDYGFLFRDEYGNNQYRLVVSSDRRWMLFNNTGSSNSAVLKEGRISNLDGGGNNSNTIKLICQGSKGMLYVNDVLIAELDLTVRMNSGDIAVATGIIEGDEINGYFTYYEDFTVWEIP